MTERHEQTYNDPLHDDMAGMMHEIVKQAAPGFFESAIQTFPRNAFFGVSATGSAQDGAKYPYVVPWRVEDPLLWLLSELEVIPKAR
jgi:hypothetical protein